MKDRQVEQTTAQLRIPLLSTVLHCVSMTALVFLRSGFGYAYLRPKSIFIAFSWAFALFSFYAWHEPHVWAVNAAVCIFGIASIALYFLHLSWSFVTELHGSARHDNYAGVPHTLRIVSLLGISVPESFRQFWAIWAEPGVVLLASQALHIAPFDGRNLSKWLLICAGCLWLKEALNYWLQIRQRKRHRDALEDAGEGMNADAVHQNLALPTASRKAKVRRQRVSQQHASSPQQDR